MAYLCFAGDQYYASGGAGDLIGKFDTLPECWAAADKYEGWSGTGCEWCHAISIEDLSIHYRDGFPSLGMGENSEFGEALAIRDENSRDFGYVARPST